MTAIEFRTRQTNGARHRCRATIMNSDTTTEDGIRACCAPAGTGNLLIISTLQIVVGMLSACAVGVELFCSVGGRRCHASSQVHLLQAGKEFAKRPRRCLRSVATRLLPPLQLPGSRARVSLS